MSSAVLTVYNLSKSYVIFPVFAGVTFTVNAGERVALVGPNGVGKSTLLKIIAGLEAPTSGSVVKARGMRTIYLPQEAASSFASEADLSFSHDATFHDSMLEGTGIKALQAELHDLEAQMAQLSGEEWNRLMSRYEETTHRFEIAGGYEMENRIEQVLQGLGFKKTQFNQPLSQMSGGQRTRAALARALLSNPDILLLDEPTNHLDIEAIEWLEGFLSQWQGTLLTIAHDRRFLNKVTTRTLDMEFTRASNLTFYSKSGQLRDEGEQEAFSKLQDYPAPYDKYLALKKERYERLMAEYEAQQETIKKTEEFIRRYLQGQKTRQAKGRRKRLWRLDKLERPPDKAQLRLTLRAHVRSGLSVFEAEDLVIGYQVPSSELRVASTTDGPEGTKERQTTDNSQLATRYSLLVLARCPDLEIERGERVALIGPNGVGKTTLLKTITGEIEPLSGHSELGHNVKFGYYSQTHEGLHANNTVIDEVRSVRLMTEETARDLLAKMLFTGDSLQKRIADLSGGERSRVALTKLTLTDANFLVLDEPTNHLDLDAQEALTNVLSEYEGTILFVSHDRAFIDDIATQVWVMEEGTLTTWEGDYSDYLAERARREELGLLQSENGAAESESQHPAAEVRQQSKAAQRQERATQRERARLLKRRDEAEARISELEARLNATSDALTAATEARNLEEIVRLGTDYARLEVELDEAYTAWQQTEEEAANA
jgi:ATP-binding cassette subfamily F protein 3